MRKKCANFGKAFNTAGNHSQEDIPYFLLRGKYSAFTLEVAGDLTGRSGLSGGPWYSLVNGGIRVSGEKIANLVTFDATYRIRGGDPNAYERVDDGDSQSTVQPDGTGKTTNSFTLAGQLGLLDDALGIQLAYTGQFRLHEDRLIANTTIKQKGPYFHGIDLRFQYTGIDPFRFNLNNNISFSSIGEKRFTGTGLDPEAIFDFWDSVMPSNGDTSYDWFSMYNALGAQYRLTDKLNLWFEVGNKFSFLTSTQDNAVRNDNYNVFGTSLKAVFTLTTTISVEAGLAFYHAAYTWKINDTQYDSSVEETGTQKILDNVTTNNTVFQVPLRIRIVY